MSSSRVQQFGAAVFSVLMMTSMFVGVVALGTSTAGTDGSSIVAAQPPSSTIAFDNTSDDVVSPGERTTVADYEYEISGNVTNVSVNLTGGANADNITPDDVTNLNVTLFNDTTGQLVSSGDVNYTSLNETVNISAFTSTVGENVTGVDSVFVRAETSRFQSEDNDTIDAVVEVKDAAGDSSGAYDTDGNQTINADFQARLRGEVVFQNGTQAEDVLVQVIDTDTGNVIVDDIKTYNSSEPQADGEWGPRRASPGNYTVELDDTGTRTSDRLGEVAVFSTQVQLSRQETEKIDTVLDPLIAPAQVNVNDVEELVGDTGTFTVQVLGDRNGQPLQGADVEITGRSGSEAPKIIANTTKTTDSNGEVTFNVTADRISTATFTFTATAANESASAKGTATFVQRGQASVEGQVFNIGTTDTVENASVWAVNVNKYRINERFTQTNLHRFDNDDVVWFRLVDNETGDIIDNDEYDVRAEDSFGGSSSNDTGVRPVESLNVSNDTVGEGYALVDVDGDNRTAFNHTRLEPEEYYIQFSIDAPNASQELLAEDGEEANNPPPATDNQTEDFINATTISSSGFITSYIGPDPVVFSPGANLTQERAEFLATLAGANLVDAPGFVNSFGVDTGGTNENGDFQLNELYSNFQEGRAYIVIAAKAGFSTDFHDVVATENGELRLNDSDDQQALALRPEPREVENLNVTQLGIHPPQAFSQSLIDTFNEVNEVPGDDEFQRVPRNGSIDVVRLETTDRLGGLNGTVEFTVADDGPDAGAGYDGTNVTNRSNVAVVGGTLQEVSSEEDTFIISTGNQSSQFGAGEALVLYQPTLSTETVDVNKTGEVITDERIEDSSNATFVGVINISETGSLSGIVTNPQNERLPFSAVYTNEFETRTGLEYTIEPDVPITNTTFQSAGEVLLADWRIVVNDTATDVEEVNATVKGWQLSSKAVDQRVLGTVRQNGFNGTNGTTSGDAFENLTVTADGNDEGLTLLTFPSEVQGEAQYTLPRVPANDSSVVFPYTEGAQYETVAAFQITSGKLGQGDSVGFQGVSPGQTQEANIVIQNATPADEQFVVRSLSAPDNATAGEQITVTATVQNQNAITGGTQSVGFRLDTDGDGSLEVNETVANQTVTLAGGESETVTFTVQVPSVNDGVYDHGVFTETSNETATINVSSSGTLQDRFDANDDGVINQSEVIDAITAFNDPSDDRLTQNDQSIVISIINEFNGNQQWADVN